ncbi:hypothetical protein CAPTEDRAFT_216462 [Capitella teleta]|uniref:GH10 domain-containing protein n=1 Tax=Capitella teleta TaxID=283909 RepID=R7TDY8_CAPTE|nr:hypothetical protein CAPTEDRAFT_216462 [Capitella teleta]|eukprot:ELT91934.1 hypothetical protein CAPTEDRAFT_216462 [Capitella teleta]
MLRMYFQMNLRILTVVLGSLTQSLSLPSFKSKDVSLDGYISADSFIRVKEGFPVSKVPVSASTTYYFTGKARMLEDPEDVPFLKVNTYARLKLITGAVQSLHIGSQMMVNVATGWFEFGGDLTTPEGTVTLGIKVSVIGHQLKVEVDGTSLRLQELSVDANWKEEANKRIDSIRKGDLQINFKVDSNYDTSKLEFHLGQTKTAFPIGSTVTAGRLNSNTEVNIKYTEALTKYFNMGVPPNELKFRLMESTEGSPRFDWGDRAIDGLEKLNLKSRAHCLVWGRSDRIPSWLLNKDAKGIKEALIRRWTYMAEHWGDRFAHYDVNNEQLHGQWYSGKLNDTDLLTWMFKEFHSLVPSAKLFVNDFAVFAGATHNIAYKRQVERLLATGAPVGGIGVQAHFSKPSPMVSYMVSCINRENDCGLQVGFQKRLDVLAQTGIPIWLTEMDVRFGNDDEQVAFLDDILRLTFSLPYVEGIIFWGFWDGHIENNVRPFMTGPNFELTKYGEKFDELLLKEWRTHETFGLPSTLSVSKRAFYGQYKLTATYENSTLWTKDIELKADGNGNAVYDIDI